MIIRRIVVLFSVFLLVAVGYIGGCRDTGSEPPPVPVITTIDPDSGAANSQVRIEGTGFGSTQGTNQVLFGTSAASHYDEWRDDQIKVRVPAAVQSGTIPITVRTTGGVSNARNFKVLGQGGGGVLFSAQIQPILTSGCADRNCHPGGGAPFSLLQGQSHTNLVGVAPAHVPATTGSCAPSLLRVKPFSADSSALYLRLTGTSCGVAMPLSGSMLTATEINLIRDWINQGAQNN